ncbi:hypothetical protein VDF98_03275 [Xanthomonas campestris pv. raphani]|uniref:hypothetical protein n=1 Tax=Xanthomonas campestris TaxID=339 RepID=UPI002367D5D4|nr:hypothetical protein [Xanthomonas campestris]MEA9822442.1 hypothetical protein [Xanthomonas campestris pv. raphani]MEA9850825.1 hypothetical protein [Xanthomonas campestris pv. raphani]MEA9854998.1 hypothetical protein [Xanthomonas campestris pv. raphani]MEA9963885.1 hypothetical protein [Xanthomonas campestris pv. raphani]WDJ24285.1 hypothetical protein JH270_10515 [Xanthomonas campestris pv. raphani]
MAESENTKRPIILDAEKIRRPMLLNIFDGTPLYGLDEEYVFFYDETNNVRKFWITDDGLNQKPTNFVLAGLVHKKSTPITGIEGLISSLHIQKSATEIKFNQLATGSYLGVLNSKRIQTLLGWLNDKEIFIHYSKLNLLYWSLVDIIDSVWDEPGLREYMPYVMHIKGELFNLANADLGKLVPLLKKYRFPNVKRAEIKVFMLELVAHLDSVAKKPLTDISELVLMMIRKASNLEEPPFIIDNEDDILIEDFHGNFLRSLYIYPTSTHIFDQESEVQQDLANTQVRFKDKFVDYSFVDSQDRIEVQLSDGICGLLGSHFNFLEENTFEELIKIKENLNPRQKTTLYLLQQLIDKSNSQSNGFMHRISPVDSDYKNDFFLHNCPLPPHVLL